MLTEGNITTSSSNRFLVNKKTLKNIYNFIEIRKEVKINLERSN